MNMNKQRGFIYEALAFILIFAIVLSVNFIGGYIGCKNRWAESGYKSQYQIFGGCMIQTKEGRWLPEKALRDVTL